MPSPRTRTIVIAALASLVTAAVPAFAQDAARSDAKSARQGDPYLLDVCPVSKEKLGSMGEPVVIVHEGRELRFCCKGCIKEFRADPAAVTKAADEAIVKRQLPYYPAKVCVVSGEPLEEPVDVVHMNRLVRLCCRGCQKDFAKDPASYLEKLDKLVIEMQREHYPLEKCPLSGEPVDAESVEVVYGNRLMRFCCNRCVRGFEKSPAAHVAALDAAWRARHAGGAAHGAEHGAAGGHDAGHEAGHGG